MKRNKISKKLKKLKFNIIKFILTLSFLFVIIILNIINNYFNKVNIDIDVNIKEAYLAINETVEIKSSINNLKYISADNSIATVNNGIITGIKKGETTIKVKKGNTIKNIKVYVSDLYTTDILNNNKEYLKCGEYSEKENIYLDKVLEYKIKQVGYKTRASAVEAARFLTLEFKYKIHYFYENGRLLTNGTRSYVDGEGRYYHKGLYLNEFKIKNITSNLYGPEIWGCDLYTKILGEYTPNGLDCSGFISWVLLNAGFDVGDAGAGISDKKTNDLDDLGKKIEIDKNSFDKVKVGDLLSRDGHIGILIGIDKNTYYVAEALDYDLHVLTYNQNELLKSDWLYFINLDDLYINDGNLTNMW